MNDESQSRAEALTGQHIHALMMAQSTSCTCLTKNPDPQYHDAMCRYWLLAEVIDFIEHRSSQPAEALSARVKLLTDERIKEAVDAIDFGTMVTADDYIYVIARAIEREVRASFLVEQSAAEPADERAAFELLRALVADDYWSESKANRAREILARAAVSPAAEAVTYERVETAAEELGLRMHDFDHAEGNDLLDLVRAFAVPQPAQTDASDKS